ncbi:unnamed protein product [Anisakis simplex]|uniref:Lipoprotein n=1 Tax=Anisakis simplex TaxID=6269 RepID=A0A0M3JTG8_ANISI|nr:unnamed protein product [Anisakis simplex]
MVSFEVRQRRTSIVFVLSIILVTVTNVNSCNGGIPGPGQGSTITVELSVFPQLLWFYPGQNVQGASGISTNQQNAAKAVRKTVTDILTYAANWASLSRRSIGSVTIPEFTDELTGNDCVVSQSLYAYQKCTIGKAGTSAICGVNFAQCQPTEKQGTFTAELTVVLMDWQIESLKKGITIGMQQFNVQNIGPATITIT